MSVTLTLGWWLAPASITLICFTLAWFTCRDDGKAYGYAAIGQGVIELIIYGFATVASLIAWLIWAVLT